MATFYGTSAGQTLNGTSEADVLNGLGGNDILNGYAGNDTLNGGTGADVMRGGSGNDNYYVDHASDTVTELAGEGTDTVRSSISYTLGSNVENGVLRGTAAINLTGNSLANSLTGNAGANSLAGGAGNDVLKGGGGADRIEGGVGNDKIYGGTENDVIVFRAGDGSDTVLDFAAGDTVNVYGYASAQSLAQVGSSVVAVFATGNQITFSNTTIATVQSALRFDGGVTPGPNTINGTSASDLLNGTALNDTINGFAGDDTIAGGAGNDRIVGGAGRDVMTGGSGSDTFVFLSASESPPYSGWPEVSDLITDWEASDRIDLSAIDANELLPGNQAFVFGGYAFGHPPTVTAPGTFTIGGFGGTLVILAYTDDEPGPDFQIDIWSAIGESGLTVDQIFI